MAGEILESTLIIKDKASEALENIEKQSSKAMDALAEVEAALNTIDAAGDISAAVRAGGITSQSAGKAKSQAGASASSTPDEPPGFMDYFDPDAYEDAIADNYGNITDAANEVTQCLDETAGALDGVKNALYETDTALGKLDHNNIGLSALEEAADHMADAVRDECGAAEKLAEQAAGDWMDATDAIKNAAEDVTKETRKTGKEVERGARGLGADIGGWWTVIKDALSKIGSMFQKLAQESDLLNIRIARFGLVADAEGKKGRQRGERSEELYRQHQKFAQALGVKSEAFNETVLNMYSNGAGVVKSIEDAQQIAAASYMAMDIAGLSGGKKNEVMAEVQSMVSVGIADPDQIQHSMEIAPNILRTIEKQWEKNMNGRAFKLNDGTEIKDATGKIAILAQQGQITADLVAQAMVNSAKETQQTWQALPSTWEKLRNRIGVIAENMTADIIRETGRLADNAHIARFVESAIRLGEDVVEFTKKFVMPVVGGALLAIMSALTTIFDTLSSWYTAVPVMLAAGAALVQAAAGAGLLTKAVAALRVAMTAISAHPVIAILGAVLLATFAVAHLVRTTQEGQEIMLLVTAAITMAFQQTAAAIMNLPDIIISAWRGVQSFFSEFVTGMLKLVATALEKLSQFSDTAKEASESIRATIAQRETDAAAFDKESQELKKGWQGEFSSNYQTFQNYKARIPDIAKENLARGKDELKLTGFLDKVLKNQANQPGTKNNPAHVKGKVAIDGEYFDIISRAAGVEIVNRYTTLRPTVNARFGDIHQIDAKDILSELGRSIQDAEGAAISDAQAAGA